MITIKKIKELRESFGFTHLVLFGICKGGKQHIATHGETMENAKEAAEMGNRLKAILNWPEDLQKAEPLRRICGNCFYWVKEGHYSEPMGYKGKCYIAPNKVTRWEMDRACKEFVPIN